MARKDGGYRLPSELNPARKCIMLEIPKNREHMIAFTGALQELTKWWNWERDDNKTGLAAALVWQDVLSQLVGQIDYADPEIWEGCMLPPNFRLTEACELQYTNDGGETWTTVSGWPEFNECFAGPAGPEGPEGPAGPAGPTGPTGVVTAQLVRVDGDTPPDFYYTPATQTLTAVLQEQWFRGIRTQPAEWTLSHQPAQTIEIQTYDNPTEWLTLVTIPPYGQIPDVSAPVGSADMPDSDKICLAARNAAEVFIQTYTQVGEALTAELFDNPLDLLRELADSIVGLIVGDMTRALFDEAATILSFLGIQHEYASNPWDSNYTPLLVAKLEELATINSNGGVSFDRDELLIWLNAQWTSGIPFDHKWGLMMDIVRFAGPDAVDIAGAVGFYTDPSPCWDDTAGMITFMFNTALPPDGLNVLKGQWTANTGIVETIPDREIEFELTLPATYTGPVDTLSVQTRVVSGGGSQGSDVDTTFSITHADGVYNHTGFILHSHGPLAFWSSPHNPPVELYGVRKLYYHRKRAADATSTLTLSGIRFENG